jgi:putative membrane protein
MVRCNINDYMNKLSLLTAILPVVLALQTCRNNTRDDNDLIVDSSVSIKTAYADVKVAPEQADIAFVATAARSGLNDMELGKLARTRGGNKRVKRFGMIMITEHAKINSKIRALASAKNIPLPAGQEPEEQEAISTLSKRSGNDFDKAYIHDSIANYGTEIATFETAAKNCADPDIKSFAAKTLPRLKAHLDAMVAINDSMK